MYSPGTAALLAVSRCDDALVGTLAEGARRVLGRPFGVVVGHQCGDVATRAWQRADDHADPRAAQRQRQVLLQQRPGGNDLGHVLAHRRDGEGMQLHQNFRDAEKADHRRDIGNPAGQFDDPVGETAFRRQRIEADHSDQHTERAGEDALGERLAGQTADQQDSPDGEHQVITRREQQREVGQDGGADGKRGDADEAAEHRHHGGEADRRSGLAALGQRVAVQCGGDRRRRARNVEQDGAARTAVDAAKIDSGDQRQRFVHVPLERERNQDRNRHRHRQPGNGTDVDAGERACRRQEEQIRVRPRHEEVRQRFGHSKTPRSTPSGSTTENAVWKIT